MLRRVEMSRGNTPWQGRMGTSFALAGALALVLLACGQERLHSDDSDTFVLLLQSDQLDAYARHVAFLPLVRAVWSLIAPFGGGAFEALVLASTLGSTVGLFCVHRALVRLRPAGADPLLAALGVAATPAVLYFATAAEVHGVFMAGVGLAWWAFAVWTERRTAAAAAALGAACGIAACLHSLGCLLPPMFAGVAAALRLWPRRALLQAAAGSVGFVGTALLLSLLLRGSSIAQAADASRFLQHWAVGLRGDVAAARVFSDWLVVFSPWSWLALGGLFVARARPWALATAVALVVHLPITLLLLCPSGRTELGAYHLPIAVPAVATAAALLPRRWLLLAVLGSAVLAGVYVGPQLRSSYPPELVDGIEQMRRERPFTLLAAWPELEAVRKHFAGLGCFDVVQQLELFSVSREHDRAPTTLVEWFDATAAMMHAQGAPFLLTEAASERLAASPRADVRELVGAHVDAVYRREPVARAGLRGALLLPRQ